MGLHELTNELLVLEILSRSVENRRYLRSTVFIHLLYQWLRKTIRSFPADDENDMLSFGTQASSSSNSVYIRVLKVILVIVDHWLCLPYPVDSSFPFLNLISMADSINHEECKIDVGIELSFLLVKAQRANKEEWTPVIQHLLRLVVGCIPLSSNLRRRVQLDRLLREIKIGNITGSQLVKLYEDPSIYQALIQGNFFDVLLVLLLQLKKEQVGEFLLRFAHSTFMSCRLMQSLPSIQNSRVIHVFLTIMMNYCSYLTDLQITSFLLPFFSSLSSLKASYD